MHAVKLKKRKKNGKKLNSLILFSVVTSLLSYGNKST